MQKGGNVVKQQKKWEEKLENINDKHSWCPNSMYCKIEMISVRK